MPAFPSSPPDARLEAHPKRWVLGWMSVPVMAGLFAVGACGTEGPTGGGTEVAEIVTTPATATLLAFGETVEATASVRTADGTSLQKRVQWSTSNGSVASVTASGDLNERAQITARGNGQALITVTADGVMGGMDITVAQSVASLSFVELPQDVVFGQTSGDVSVSAVDAGGSAVETASGPVTLDTTSDSPGGLVGGARSGEMSAGVVRFLDVQADQIGNDYRLSAAWDGRTASSNRFDVVLAFDAIRVTNGTGAEAGFLVDGFRSGGVLNDFAVVSDGDVVEVGVVDAAPSGRNEVVAFAPARRPALVSAPWSSGVDTAQVALDAPIELDVALWIVRGPFGEQSGRALDAIATTRSIWDAENAGLGIDSVEVIDATGDADAAALFRPTLCNLKDDLETRIGRRDGVINVYYVETVDGGTDRGRACPIGGDHIIMAERSGRELLAHEMGHLLSLTHVDALTQHFDRTNVMHSASSTRRYLTEGQVFRQQFDPNSAINGIFQIRSAQARSCPRDTSSSTCPAIEGRIWQDGSFPPTLDRSHPVTRDLARLWVETSCGMEENEGMSGRLRAAGDEGVEALVAIAMGDGSLQHRRVALDGLAIIGSGRARAALLEAELQPELAEAAAAARSRLGGG